MRSRISGALAVVSLATIAPAGVAAGQVSIDWVEIGNAGNSPDPLTGYGQVVHAYRIARNEVTNTQYAAFLNAVAASDPNELYSFQMGFDGRGGITRSGVDGAYTYAVRPNMGNKPVNWVSWYDAARYCNWLTNGQGLNGGSGDTESGVYTLTGPTTIVATTRDLADPSQVFLPTEDEWYKAAYYHPFASGGDDDNYWLYATRSNTDPIPATATPTGDVANPGPEVVNYMQSADWNGFADGNLTTVGSAGPDARSWYGVSDLNGNVSEWTESADGDKRVNRGGAYAFARGNLQSRNRFTPDPFDEDRTVGFRVASPPQAPCSADVNGDGLSTPADFTAWLSIFNNQATATPGELERADVDNDGSVTAADFTAWLAAFNAGC